VDVSLEDYFDRLPDHVSIVRQVFLETRSTHLSGDELPATEELPRERLPASRLGEFPLVRAEMREYAPAWVVGPEQQEAVSR
jgi:hypothetical protein